MAIAGLNHFNIMGSRSLIDEVRDFYVDVIGLSEGWRPDFDVEGEVIGLNVVRFVAKKNDAKRMKFSSLTASGMRHKQRQLYLEIYPFSTNHSRVIGVGS